MRHVLILVAICGSGVARGQSLESSATWMTGVGGNGHEYRLYSVTGGMNWGDAESFAEALGGMLATIGSPEENQFVYDSLGIAGNNAVWHVDSYNSQIGPWLGGFQAPGSAEPGGGWGWVSGETMSFTAWWPGEPNNLGGTENRIHYFGNPNRSSNWNDITDTVPIEGFVVELSGCNAADLAAPYGLLDLVDVTTFVSGFVNQLPIADLDGNGLYDLADAVAFVEAFLVGCP